MSRRAVVGGLGAALLAPRLGVAAAPPAPAVAARAGRVLGARVLASLARANASANVVVAPHCLHSALTMLASGAGETLKRSLQMSPLTWSSASLETVIEGYRGLRGELSIPPGTGVELQSLAATWIREAGQASPAVREVAASAFDTKIESLEFASPGAAQIINSWVAEATRQRIPALIDRLDPATQFLIATAMYFRGQWATPFDPARTALKAFRRAGGAKTMVPTMSGLVAGGFWEGRSLRVITLPYGAGTASEFEFVIVQSKRRSRPFSPAAFNISQALSVASPKPAMMRLEMPKFKVRFAGALQQPLSAAGLTAMFAPGATYPGYGNLVLSAPQVTHAVDVEVDEAGTVAAAATAISASRALIEPRPVVIDSPFGFVIRHKRLGVDLVQGYVQDPEAGA